jgi:hypothetical protein
VRERISPDGEVAGREPDHEADSQHACSASEAVSAKLTCAFVPFWALHQH